MGVHLTVISYPQRLHPMFEAVASAANNQLSSHKFVRCQWGNQMPLAITNSAPIDTSLLPTITTLDLVGHGRAGFFELGDHPLVDGKTVSDAVLELGSLLPPTATIRFLGCMTGSDDRGLEMLESVSHVLRQEVVVTTAILHPHHFGPKGLSKGFEHLLSSRARKSSRAARAFARPAPPRPGARALKAAARWKPLLPEGYELIGREHVAAAVDFSLLHQGTRLTFACDCQLVLIEDRPAWPPLLFQWSRPGPVPLSTLLLRPSVEQLLAHG